MGERREGGGRLAPAPAQSPLSSAGPAWGPQRLPGSPADPQSSGSHTRVSASLPAPSPRLLRPLPGFPTQRVSGLEGLRMRFSQVPGDAAAAALGTTLGKPAGQAFQILSSPPAGSLLASCVSGEQSFIPRRRKSTSYRRPQVQLIRLLGHSLLVGRRVQGEI